MSSRYKVALISICLNEPYWQFQKPMIESARKFLLKGHEVEFLTWSDMPPEKNVGDFVFKTEPFKWPLPTLFRYHLFLKEEEKLREYDYVFYCDSDMLFVSPVGDEILGDGLTAAQHPMFALRQEYHYPYEPNPDSTAHIPATGRVVEKDGQKKFEPLYAAGGFQGGRTEEWITAMKVMKERIDVDFAKGYIARWNDESHWNRYLFENPPSIVLNPSYVMPDSLNKAYYQKLWGRNFVPKLITLTKQFSLSKDGGAGLHQILNT